MKENVKKDLLLDLLDSIVNALSDEAERTALLEDSSFNKLLKDNNSHLVAIVKEWSIISFHFEDNMQLNLEDEDGKTMVKFNSTVMNGSAIAKAILEIILDYVR